MDFELRGGHAASQPLLGDGASSMPACDVGTVGSPPLASLVFALSSYVSRTSYTVGKSCEAEDSLNLPL